MKVIYYDKSKIFSGAEKSLLCLINTIPVEKKLILFNYPIAHHRYYICIRKIYRNNKLKFWMGSDFSTKNLRGTDLLKRIIFAYQLFQILKDYKPDILHFNLYRDTDFLDLLVARLCKVKSVVHVRSLLSQVNINCNVIKQADQIIATSNFVKNEIHSVCPALNVKAIYDPIDILDCKNLSVDEINEFKLRLGLEKQDIFLASIGILDKRKGHDTAIKAVAELNKEFDCFKLFIAGGNLEKDKDELQRLERLVGKHNLNSKVFFLGNVEDMDLLYASSDFILALSRDGEAFGRVPLEAAKFKKVVIGTKMGATPEIIENYQTGFLVDSDDYKLVANLILKLKDDHSLLQKIGENAYENLVNRFSTKKHCDNILAVYENLLHC